ncbi:MAG TPA: hypothetical protein PKZ36_03330 [Candidatus Paceibacterota bacterium]|nr:hypothetical protein [Candidatus Paceibacterota bacterium]HPT18409.1 hypothetical protein [Candidatus Paceibacterota bacterium]
MSKNKTGLVVGSFFALIHLVWSIAVAIAPVVVENFMNWILQIHHISVPFFVIATPFVLANAIVLIVVTFVLGYILGYILKGLVNIIKK